MNAAVIGLAGDWHFWVLLVLLVALLLVGAYVLARPARAVRIAPELDGDAQSMADRLAADWAAAGYVRPEPTQINLGEYALTPAAEDRTACTAGEDTTAGSRMAAALARFLARRRRAHQGRHTADTVETVLPDYLLSPTAAERVLGGGEPR